jgi:hypothetical protein
MHTSHQSSLHSLPLFPWTPQIQAYSAFLESDGVKDVLSTKSKNPLAAITVLRKIATHPILYRGATERDVAATDEICTAGAARAWDCSALPSATELLSSCGKLTVLDRLLRVLRAEGQRALVFSQSSRMLDIIGTTLRSSGIRHLRIDGSMPGPDRARVVSRYNGDNSYTVCLLTTGVGSLGLTLTSATRVVIYDLSWNPSCDAQAVDRAYRVGQTFDVISYRLISCGTIDEAMYRQQLFKGGLTRSVLDGSGAASTAHDQGGAHGWTPRLLSRSDLRELFKLGDVDRSETQALLDASVEPPLPSTPAIEQHLARLPRDLGCGVSHHDHLLLLSSANGGLRAQMRRNAAGRSGVEGSVIAIDMTGESLLEPSQAKFGRQLEGDKCDDLSLRDSENDVRAAVSVLLAESRGAGAARSRNNSVPCTPRDTPVPSRTPMHMPASAINLGRGSVSVARAKVFVIESSSDDGGDDSRITEKLPVSSLVVNLVSPAQEAPSTPSHPGSALVVGSAKSDAAASPSTSVLSGLRVRSSKSPSSRPVESCDASPTGGGRAGDPSSPAALHTMGGTEWNWRLSCGGGGGYEPAHEAMISPGGVDAVGPSLRSSHPLPTDEGPQLQMGGSDEAAYDSMLEDLVNFFSPAKPRRLISASPSQGGQRGSFACSGGVSTGGHMTASGSSPLVAEAPASFLSTSRRAQLKLLLDELEGELEGGRGAVSSKLELAAMEAASALGWLQ